MLEFSMFDLNNLILRKISSLGMDSEVPILAWRPIQMQKINYTGGHETPNKSFFDYNGCEVAAR